MNRDLSSKQQPSYNHQTDKHYLVQVNRQYKCVCELCSCGKHRCPRPPIKSDFQTSYKNQFKNVHVIVPTNSPPPYRYQDRHYNLDALRSNYQQTFTQKPPINSTQNLNSSRLQNIGKSIMRPHVPFVGSTSYNEQYKPFNLQSNYNPQNQDQFITRREMIPSYGFRSPVKFQDATSYNSHYQVPTPTKLQKSPYPQYRKPDVHFNASTSYKDQYQPYRVEPSFEHLSRSVSNVPKVKFDGQTTYNQLFKDYQIQPQQPISGKSCQFDNMNIPETNFLNSSPHIYYDQRERKNIN